jgi:hypothetical protein
VRGDVGSLVLLHSGELKLGDREEQGGEELAHGAGHVDLLGDRDDADAVIQPELHDSDPPGRAREQSRPDLAEQGPAHPLRDSTAWCARRRRGHGLPRHVGVLHHPGEGGPHPSFGPPM